MPAPHGKPSRTNNFLLRMDDQENAFVRALARTQGTSLNDAICGIIRERMARYGEPPAPRPDAPPATAPPRGAPSGLAGLARAAGAPKKRRNLDDPDERKPGPGQAAITDPDQ